MACGKVARGASDDGEVRGETPEPLKGRGVVAGCRLGFGFAVSRKLGMAP